MARRAECELKCFLSVTMIGNPQAIAQIPPNANQKESLSRVPVSRLQFEL